MTSAGVISGATTNRRSPRHTWIGWRLGYSPALIEWGRETFASLFKLKGQVTDCIGKCILVLAVGAFHF
jgi:hypothetical protein